MYVLTLCTAIFILPVIFAGNDECLSKGQCTALDDVTCVPVGAKRLEKCNAYICKKMNNDLTYKIVNRLLRCPKDGGCEDEGATKFADCTTHICVLSKRRKFMQWKIVKTGCSTDEGCKYDKDEWSDLDASSCVTRRCDVKYDKINKKIYWKCVCCRASSGKCYYNGETWQEGDCYNRRCDVNVTDEGKSLAAINIESGICKDADGTCKGYGEAVKYQSDDVILDCMCEQVTSAQGYPQGMPVCAIP
ncbi:uncharacterized protein LOC132553601 [Ylistrum balloti]|uniref:uncharacterized protein LOC132553601 n=1 Tax=Ylistrum balloti TaxID=509963 RepID=UPI002905EFA3|nr:uncharacterized protein LOC132553601 [Ylistrum balloti]